MGSIKGVPMGHDFYYTAIQVNVGGAKELYEAKVRDGEVAGLLKAAYGVQAGRVRCNKEYSATPMISDIEEVPVGMMLVYITMFPRFRVSWEVYGAL
jgi:hypothetical protein